MSAYVFTVPFRTAMRNGVAEAGAQAVFTLSGTTTLTPAYTDMGLSVEASNPLVAGALGNFDTVYLDDAIDYRLRIFAADADITTDTPLLDVDPYTPTEQGAAADNPNYTYVINTLAAGASATLGATGTYPNVTLTFGIPRGAAGASGALSDGDFGDLVVSSSGTVLTVDSGAITLAKMANLAEDRIIGRQSAGAGVPEALTIGVSAAGDIPDRAAGDTRWIQRTESLVHSLYIPASAMVSRTTNGAAVGSTETTVNKVMLSTLDFDQSTIEYAQFGIAMPKSWNEGTITFAPVWTAASGTGDVIWGLQAVAISNDDALDAAFGTAATSTDTLIATSDQHTGPTSAAITVGGSPAAEDLVQFQVYRNASSGSDTLTADAKLIGVRVNITTNAADDS